MAEKQKTIGNFLGTTKLIIFSSALLFQEYILAVIVAVVFGLSYGAHTQSGFLEDYFHWRASQLVSQKEPDVVVIEIDDNTMFSDKGFIPEGSLNTSTQIDDSLSLCSLVKLIAQAHPKVIALDYFFEPNKKKETFNCGDGSKSIGENINVPIVVTSRLSNAGFKTREIEPSHYAVNHSSQLWGHSQINHVDDIARTINHAPNILNGNSPSLAITAWLLSLIKEDGSRKFTSGKEVRNFLKSCKAGQKSEICNKVVHRLLNEEHRIFYAPFKSSVRIESAKNFLQGSICAKKIHRCAEGLKDKIVLIGSSHLNADDTFQIPFVINSETQSFFDFVSGSQPVPGVYVHAMAISNIIDGKVFAQDRRIEISIIGIIIFILLAVFMVILKQRSENSKFWIYCLSGTVIFTVSLVVVYPMVMLRTETFYNLNLIVALIILIPAILLIVEIAIKKHLETLRRERNWKNLLWNCRSDLLDDNKEYTGNGLYILVSYQGAIADFGNYADDYLNELQRRISHDVKKWERRKGLNAVPVADNWSLNTTGVSLFFPDLNWKEADNPPDEVKKLIKTLINTLLELDAYNPRPMKQEKNMFERDLNISLVIGSAKVVDVQDSGGERVLSVLGEFALNEVTRKTIMDKSEADIPDKAKALITVLGLSNLDEYKSGNLMIEGNYIYEF
ncbi:CHASE2 domain-containing protein [Terasakiella pusilla]|uniref:CHASE2 domain-containing protein n=1 Tax=Terasakiella pusilla TaxID=64973 RepID=UPI003AA7FA13